MAEGGYIPLGALNVVHDHEKPGCSYEIPDANLENIPARGIAIPTLRDFERAYGRDAKSLAIPSVRDFESSQSLADYLLAKAQETEVAAKMIKAAANECRNITAYAEESVTIAEENSARAKRKAWKSASLPEAEHHRRIADKLDTAAKLTVRRARDFSDSLERADRGARLAFSKVFDVNLDLRIMDAKFVHESSLLTLLYAKRSAYDRTSYLKEDEYYVLKGMKRCWERHPPPMEADAFPKNNDPETPLIPRNRRDNDRWGCILMTLTIIAAVAECLMFILILTLDADKYSFAAMLTVLIVSTLWTFSYIIAKIIKRHATKRKLAYIQRRDFMLKFIDERLEKLTEYFINKNKLVPSDSEEEKNPQLRIVQRSVPMLLIP